MFLGSLILSGLIGLSLAVESRFADRRALADEPAKAAAKGPKLSHIVFFALNDPSPENKKKVIEASKRDLTGHPGEVSFSVGVLSDENDKTYNVRDFDIALNMVFENRAAFAAYIPSEKHQHYVKEIKPLFKTIRVFDSDIDEN